MKIGIIGNGWRAQQFLRIIRELPELFEVSGILLRSAEKAADFSNRTSLPAFSAMDSFLASGPDFVLLLIPRSEVLSYCKTLYQQGIPVLTETPPCNGLEELNKAWQLQQEYNGSIQVAEQYPPATLSSGSPFPAEGRDTGGCTQCLGFHGT